MGNSKWESFPINELCIFAIDCVNKTAPIVDYETPYKMIRTTNVKDGFIDIESVRYVTEETYKKWTRRSKPQYGDVILTREAPVGSVGRFTTDDTNIFLGQRLFHYRPNPEKLDWNYLSYILQSEALQGWLNGIAFGATVPHITVADAETIKIPTPPIDIQKKIGKILSNYDNLIENNLKQIKLLEEKARITYEEWFLRFRIDGQKLDIDEDTGLPFGWESKNLFDLADVRYGYPFKAEQFNNENNGTPIIRIRNISSSSTNDYTTEKVDNRYIVNKGDLLIGMDGEFHVNHWTGEQGYLVQRVCSIQTKENSLFGYFSEAIKPKIKYYEETISGATVAHLGKMHLEKIEIVIPSEDILKKLEIFNILLKEKINLATQNNLLKESRDILLPRLMTGMIDVDKMDIEV